MKKLFFIFLMVFWLTGCAAAPDIVLSSLPGEGQGKLHTHGKFQDYTDYGKYFYPELCNEALGGNSYFQRVKTEDISVINEHLKDFEKWVELAEDCDDCSLEENYDFDSEIIREGDWFYLDSDNTYNNYSLYYICMNTKTVYFFHNNI